MSSKTRSMPANPPPSATITDATADRGSDRSGPAEPDMVRGEQSVASRTGAETRAAHMRRKAHRGRLYGYAIVTVALIAYLIALAASNTAHVSVHWVFGSSRVSLVWLGLST